MGAQGGWSRSTVFRLAVAVLAAVIGAAVALAVGGSTTSAKGTTVRFLSPFADQPNAFTPSAAVRWHATIKWSGPFGGTGSNSVCDRDLLIHYLTIRPDRLRAWAQVEGVAPNQLAVSKFVHSLEPATLVRDTRVTDYSYLNGRAYGFQVILQAGTAVLVDARGNIRARCQCGNPLAYPVLYAVESCLGCSAGYSLPLSGASYAIYPDPPPINGPTTTLTVTPPPPPTTTSTTTTTRTITRVVTRGGTTSTTTVPVVVTQPPVTLPPVTLPPVTLPPVTSVVTSTVTTEPSITHG